MIAARIVRTAATCALLASVHAMALDPSLELSQYGHAAWRNREGFASAGINAIAQTTDGYLWLGTTNGLFRFDGVLNVPAPIALPHERVRALLGARDGTLWIGMWRGLGSWKDGKLTTYPALDGKAMNGFVEDADGTIWIAASDFQNGFLCAFRLGRLQCDGADGSLGSYVRGVCLDARGSLWVIGRDRVWRWKPGTPVAYPLADIVDGLGNVTGTRDGGVLVPTRRGIVRIPGYTIERFTAAPAVKGHTPRRIMRDRDGGVWLGTMDAGLLHSNRRGLDAFGPADGLSDESITSMFEDREGNVWIGTHKGLDLFRPMTAASFGRNQGIAGNQVAVLAARDGSVWIATFLAIYRMRDGRLRKVRDERGATLFEDVSGRIWIGGTTEFGHFEGERFVRIAGMPSGYIDAMAEDPRGNLWIAHRDAGLVRLSRDGTVTRTAWNELGDGSSAQGIAIDPKDGAPWLGLFTGQLVHPLEGTTRAPKGLQDLVGQQRVTQLAFDPEGTLWVASESGLARFADKKALLLDRKAGLPCDRVYSVAFDANFAWVTMACGLVQIPRGDLRAWADTAPGSPAFHVRARVFDHTDGIRAESALGTFGPRSSLAPDGRLWLLTQDGATVIDPAHLPFNPVVPPVHVERILADRVAYSTSASVRLPPLPRDIDIAFTATSLAVPEKVRFKYRLEGRDRDWMDANASRHAFYSDLPPGDYRFRVIAANDSGLWNEQGASVAFSIAPAWWQTAWFRLSCVATLALLLYGLHRLRMARFARQFNLTLDTRVNERLRIARELHDTLLQSFHGLILRFQTASSLLPARPVEAKQVLDGAIDQAASAVTEGRDAVHGLRASATETNDLANAVRMLGETLAAEQGIGQAPTLRLDIQGESRALHPILRDEIFRIAGEALRNAFRHARAKHVEVEIHYDARQVRVRIRDDGGGMDPEVLRQGGREGHFGLSGMRERARLVGGKLTIWSAEHSGTEVELTIPAAQAYSAHLAASRSAVSEKLYNGT